MALKERDWHVELKVGTEKLIHELGIVARATLTFPCAKIAITHTF
jgi:hypothetical protein